MSTRISSGALFFTKWLFPLAWFGFLLFFIAESWPSRFGLEDRLFVAVPILMAVMGFFFFKSLVWDLADVVDDYGTYLLVRRRGLEDRIPLENVMNVSSTTMMNPPRVTLRLLKPCVFGTYVSFSPKGSSLSFGFSTKNAVAEQLIERAYASRAKRAG